MPAQASKTYPRVKRTLRRWLPVAGTLALLTYLARSTDLTAAARALEHANWVGATVVLVLATLTTWLADSFCLWWLVERNLRDRGSAAGTTLKQLLPLKASSYVLNILNYNAATLGMAFVVARRRRVSYVEATAALSVLSYLDLLALAVMVTVGLQVAPDVLTAEPALVDRLSTIVAVIFSLGLGLLLALQLDLPWAPLKRARNWSVLRPLAAMSPVDMMVGICLRASFVLLYVGANYLMMKCFGMRPQWGAMLTIVPVLTVVGVVPLSISGLGTTQLLMRSLYAPFVTDGRDATPVIDAWSTTMILGFVVMRLLVAAPFLPKMWRELQQAPVDGDL